MNMFLKSLQLNQETFTHYKLSSDSSEPQHQDNPKSSQILHWGASQELTAL